MQDAGRRPWVSVHSVCILWLAACSVLSGCIHRSLTIKTDPPGATVYVNDQLKGESPLTYDFMWYGWYRLTIRKEGYERLDDRKLLRAPMWMWIPLDLAMELVPFRVRDQRVWSYVLAPIKELQTPLPPAMTHPTVAPSAAPAEEAPATSTTTGGETTP